MWKGKEIFGLQQFKIPQLSSDVIADVKTDIAENLVLGKRAECFFEEAIKPSHEFDLIAGNLQVIQDKHTYGEFDFFLKETATNKTLHVELVYKFYVYDPDFKEELDRWIGPNRKDSLVKKIKRLKKHQLPLLFQPESTSTLEKYGLQPEKIEQQVCFKANLFLPKKLQQQKIPYVNKDCIVGYWLHQEEFSVEEYGDFHFYSPKKPDWPIEPFHNTRWKDYNSIQEEIQYLFQHQKSALLWMKKDKETFKRLFVVWW